MRGRSLSSRTRAGTGVRCRGIPTKLVVSAVFVLGLAAASHPEAVPAQTPVRLTVTPARALVDATVDVRVEGLPAHAWIVLEAETRDRFGKLWRGRRSYRADGRGAVDTRSDMRLFSSLRYDSAGRSAGHSPRWFQPPASAVVAVRALRGRRVVARATFVRRLFAADVRSTAETLRSQGFVGSYFAARSPRRRPGVLVLGGSEGGHSRLPAALFASHGFPSLSLAYFKEPGLPQTLKNVPLEYFARALRWLAARPEVDPRRLVVFGVSRGGGAAFLVAAAYPQLVHGVIACTTNAYILGAFPGPGAAWTLHGRPIPYGPVPVTEITSPVLVTGGGRDAISLGGDSATAARTIVQLARAAGRTNVRADVYRDAGHDAGCTIPNIPLGTELQVAPGVYREIGGTAAANERAASRAWPRLLAFLHEIATR